MTKPRLSDEAVEAFKADILAVCEKHGMGFKHYYDEYNEYIGDTGYHILPLEAVDMVYDFKRADAKT